MLLARRQVPRILGEVSIAVALVVYALFRMDAMGVNLTAITFSATALAAAIGFALQPTLGNLIGGISVQADNTCRIGDWIEVDGVIGEIVSVRWRYTALATVNNVTIVIPNADLMKNRVTLLGRRGELRIPWRRPIEFTVGYEWTPGQVLAVVGAALERVEIPFVATQSPAAMRLRRPSTRSAIKYVVYYWLTRHQDLPGDRFAHARAYLRGARPGGHGDSDLPLGAVPAFGAHSAGDAGLEHERESRGGLAAFAGIVRRAHRPRRRRRWPRS